MPKLTPGQKQYRKRKKEGQRDLVRVIREDGTASFRVAKKSLCIRVSQEVFDTLTVLTQAYQMDKGEMISFMIGNSIKSLQTIPDRERIYCNGYYQELPKTEPNKPRRNGTGGEKQINVRISSTAWNKLHAFCIKDERTSYSKKRVVEQLILQYAERNSQVL